MTPKSHTMTVAAFLATLTDERRREFRRVRAVIRQHLPSGYEEVVTKGMLVYQVPFKRYSDTYNGCPLWYVAIAPQKAYLSLHLMPVYGNAAQAQRLKEGFRAAGKKLDMGKACIRFKSLEGVALDVIRDIVARVPAGEYVKHYRRSREK